MQLQGEEYTELGQALGDGRLDDLALGEPERLLLEYVGTLTRHAYTISDAQVDGLRAAGTSRSRRQPMTPPCSTCSSAWPDAFDIHPPPPLDPDGVPRAVTEGPPA